MEKHNNRIKHTLVYLVLIFIIYKDFENLLTSSWLSVGDEGAKRYYRLLATTFIVIVGVVCSRIYECRTLREWRAVMKKSILAWIVLVLCTVAFVFLMVEAYKYMNNQRDAILLIIASTAIFAPNLWALTDYVACKTQKTGNGSPS